MYAVVEFSSYGTSNEVAVVPLSWILKNETRCHWPSKANNITEVDGMIENRCPPNKYWPHYKIHQVLCKTVTYSAATEFLNKALAQSETTGAASATSVKSLIKKKTQPEEVNSSEDDDIPLKKMKQSLQSGHNHFERNQVQLQKTLTSQDIIDDRSSTSTSTITNYTIEERENNVNIINTQNNIEFQTTVLQSLAGLKTTNEQILLTLNEVLRYNKKLALEKLVPPENLPPFPLKTLIDFESFEKLLNEDPAVYQYLTRRLAALGGSGLEGVTRKILKYLLTDDLGIKFNWKGRHEKQPFENTKTMGLIYEAAKLNFPTGEKNDESIALTVKLWLKYSKARLKPQDGKV